jgi:hypothetical protein
MPGICEEIGLADYLDALAGPSQQRVSVGMAAVAMILNGFGFSNRHLYLVSQFFASKSRGAARGSGHHDRATAFPMKRQCDGTVSPTAADVKRL